MDSNTVLSFKDCKGHIGFCDVSWQLYFLIFSFSFLRDVYFMTFLALKKGNDSWWWWRNEWRFHDMIQISFPFHSKKFYIYCVYFTAENRKMNCQCFIRSNTYSIMNDNTMLIYSILKMSLMLSKIFEWDNVKIAI